MRNASRAALRMESRDVCISSNGMSSIFRRVVIADEMFRNSCLSWTRSASFKRTSVFIEEVFKSLRFVSSAYCLLQLLQCKRSLANPMEEPVRSSTVVVARKVSSHWVLETIDFNRHYCFR